jgi:hypothetical protein
MITTKNPINIIAAVGLGLGGVFGMAGTFVAQPTLQAVLWAIDGAGLVMAAAILSLKYIRTGSYRRRRIYDLCDRRSRDHVGNGGRPGRKRPFVCGRNGAMGNRAAAHQYPEGIRVAGSAVGEPTS